MSGSLTPTSSSSSTTTGSGRKSKGGGSGGGGGWFTCSKCQKRFPRTGTGKHADFGCDKGLIYPYINLKDNSIYAILVNATTTSKVQNLPFIKCSRLSGGTLFMPEELIKESGFQTFGWVTMTLEQGGDGDADGRTSVPLAMRVWPIPDSISASSTNGNVMMVKDGFLANNVTPSDGLIARLEYLSKPIFTPAVPAEKVVLEVDDVTSDIDQVTFNPDRFSQTFKTWFSGRFVKIGNSLRIRYYAEIIGFIVKDTRSGLMDKVKVQGTIEDELKQLSLSPSPEISDLKGFVQVTERTGVELLFKSGVSKEDVSRNESQNVVTLNDIGGIDPILKELLASIKFIFTSRSDLQVAKGILLYGHSGTGKSYLIKALCHHFGLKSFEFNEFAVSSKGKLRGPMVSNSIVKVVQDAISKSQAAVIIENLDILAPNKTSNNSTGEQASSNFAVKLHSILPILNSRRSKKIIVLATATDVDSIDPSLRSPQVFGKEIELPVPSRLEREQILTKMLMKIKNSLTIENIKEIASSTHGFVGADLYGLCTLAAQAATERRANSKDFSVTMEDVIPCLKSVKPSAAKSILVDVPNVRWEDIGGQHELKFKLKQAIEWPLKHPEAFQRLGIVPPKGILMYGPPGCSKTMIAKAIATESGLNFISVKGSELFSKWVGESEKAVRDVFRKARQVSPCIIFFDEIDSLGGERGSSSGSSNVHERVLAQLLVELDGIEPLKDVTIVAATNRPDIIDQALLRPGRLDRIIYVPLPNDQTRREILKICCRKMPVDTTLDIDDIVKRTEGYSGAELTAVCHEAAMKSLEENIENEIVLQHHFHQALDLVKPRISKEQIKFYEDYNKAHKRL